MNCEIEDTGEVNEVASNVFGVPYKVFYCKTCDAEFEGPEGVEREKCPTRNLLERHDKLPEDHPANTGIDTEEDEE